MMRLERPSPEGATAADAGREEGATAADVTFLKTHSMRAPDPSAVVLVPTNREADQINAARMQELVHVPEFVYASVDCGPEARMKSFRSQMSLRLRRGCRVLLVRNVYTLARTSDYLLSEQRAAAWPPTLYNTRLASYHATI